MAESDLEQRVRDFMNWVESGDFKDLEHIFQCVEWGKLCGAVNADMIIRGDKYRRLNPPP